MMPETETHQTREIIDRLFQWASSGKCETLENTLASQPQLATSSNCQKISLLMWAMYHRQVDVAKVVYRHLDNPSAEEAVAVNDVETLQAELAADSTLLNQFSKDGFTLLHYACFFANPECVTYLLHQKAEVNCAAHNPSKVYPIHSATAAQSTMIVQLLLEAGADPNVQQTGGYTPLMSAAAHNNLELIKLLLINGADKTLRDDEGRNALEHGVDKGFDMRILKS